MYNHITLLGNLTRDIEMRHSASGTAFAKTGIATSHKYKSNSEQKEETMFIDLTFIGRQAEVASQYLHKGSKVLIVGRLKLEQWMAQDGSKRSKHTVTVSEMKMLDGKSDRPQNANTKPSPQQPAQSQIPEVDFSEPIPF